MQNLKFRRAYAENILCFGPEGVHFDLENYDNVVQIRGVNLDNMGTDDDPASNGSGKSSVPEIFSIALYGRTIKSPTKVKGAKIVNVLADAGKVEFEWDDYKVERVFKRSKDSVTQKVTFWESPDHIWDDTTKVTQGKKFDTEAWVKKRFPLNHEAFCSIVLVDDSDKYTFLEATTPVKREIIENLLGLDCYRLYHENAKNLMKEQKKKIAELKAAYERAQTDVDACKNRLTLAKNQELTWQKQRRSELASIEQQISAKQLKLQNTNHGELLLAWKNAQDEISQITNQNVDYEVKRTRLVELIDEAKTKLKECDNQKRSINDVLQEHHFEVKKFESELKTANDRIAKLNRMEVGVRCPTCFEVIGDGRENALKHDHNVVESAQRKIQQAQSLYDAQLLEFKDKASKVAIMEQRIKEAEGKVGVVERAISANRTKITTLSLVQRPDSNAEERVLEAEITELRKQQVTKTQELEGKSPYFEIIQTADFEVAQKAAFSESFGANLNKEEAELPYIQFWVEAFGDDGIRKYVIDGIIPAFNARIAHWLERLTNSKIELSFDNCFEEMIIRNGNPVIYEALSRGEKRKVNLAVSQAKGYIMMLNSGVCPSLVFLDEITGGSIDRAAMDGIYNMILELAKERQVFVTTHNDTLMSMLTGCQTLTLRKENDITVLMS